LYKGSRNEIISRSAILESIDAIGNGNFKKYADAGSKFTF
jgi:hypothetical protein